MRTDRGATEEERKSGLTIGSPEEKAAGNQAEMWNRREFLKSAGAGLTVFFAVDWTDLSGQQGARRPAYPTDFNAYVRVQPSGAVTCLVGKIEMGQGSMTALAQIMADELDVSIDKVQMIMGDTDLCPWDAGTWGSQSIRIFAPFLRAAAAEARAVLIELAAERLKAPNERLRVDNGVVHDTSRPAKRVSYEDLVQGKTIERHIENPPRPKSIEQLRIVGRPVPRKDSLEKVTGRAKFSGDLRVPGMLSAALVRPPAHGARLRSVDATPAEKVEGTRVVQDGDMIAILHELPDEARRACKLVRAEWEIPTAEANDQTIFDHLVRKAAPGQTIGQTGNLETGADGASKTFDHTYYNSYVAHAAMETHTALARFEKGKMTVWASTQSPFGTKSQVAQALGLPPEDVRVVTPFVGGGFGGKSAARQAIEAARLAKAIGRPVQVVWTREEEFFYDTFRPAAVVKIRSGIDRRGDMVLWDFHVYYAGDREARQFYRIPHERTMSYGGWSGGANVHPFATGPWRAPAVNTNTFARESQIDIMASAAGTDPVEFRLKHLPDPRMQRALKTAAERFGWTPARPPSRRGVGVACAMYLGTYVATIAEVTVDKSSGHVQVNRVVCAQDAGLVINPEGTRVQIEGCCMMGLGYSLTEEIHFTGGQVIDLNFDTYEIPKFSWLPRIEAVLIDAPEQPSQGVGESAIVCMGAVLANAVHDATGARIFQLPMTPARIKAAF